MALPDMFSAPRIKPNQSMEQAMTSRRALEFMGISRSLILEAAYELVEKQGLEGLSIKALAKVVGLPPAYVGKYFSSLEHLKDAITVRALHALLEVHKDVASDRVGRDALESYALAERAFALAHPTLYPVALRAPSLPNDDVTEARRVHLGYAIAMLNGYSVPSALQAEVALCLSAALQGFINAEINSGGLSRLEFDRNYERLLNILDAGAQSAGRGRERDVEPRG